MYYFNTIKMTSETFKKNLSHVPQQCDKLAIMTPAMEKYREMYHIRLGVVENEIEGDDESDYELEEAGDSKVEEDDYDAKDEKEFKVYDRKAGDSGRNEDIALSQKKNAAIERMTRRGRHLMVFSGLKTSDFLDINNNEIAKAWAVLYHFRAKTTESMLYEEFNALVQRNSASKSKINDSFGKLYYNLLQHYSSVGIQLNLQQSCP